MKYQIVSPFCTAYPFFANVPRHNNRNLISISNAFSSIKLLNKYGTVNGRHIIVKNYEFFTNKDIIKIFDDFFISNSLGLGLFKSVTITQSVSRDSCLKDFDIIYQDLLRNIDNVAYFQKRFNIEVCVDIYVEDFDSGKALLLSNAVVNSDINYIKFIFDFPLLNKNFASSLISNIEYFCANPILKNTKIELTNLPFCFIPDAKYKLLYRHAMGVLKGEVYMQRNTIRELREKKIAYFKPCETCRCKIPCYSYTDIGRFPGYSQFLFPKTQSTVVFIGGSLRESEYDSDKDIVYTTPAQQGDVFMTILDGFKNILIIDGYFYNEFPCTTFEVLLAIEEGRNVFGSSSIGALRAVELDNYGMAGSGYVYHYLKKKKIKPYHIVAQTYDNNDKPLSVPLVHIIYFLKTALNKGIIKRSEFYKSFNVADNIHFTSLTFQYFFKSLESLKVLPQNVIERMKKYFSLRGEDGFNLKRKDALFLLRNFKSIIAKRESDYVVKVFKRAKNKYLKTLYKKYALGYNLTLPKNWPKPLGKTKRSLQNTKNIRELSPRDTCRLASIFFEDLDIVIADVSKYEQLNNVIINIFFIPFYFLDYPLSCSNGMGFDTAEALACAYMECLERIPSSSINAKFSAQTGIEKNKIYPFEKIPQFYNLDRPLYQKRAEIKKYGYAKVTEILNNRNFYIPKFTTISGLTGSDGHASGNTYPEAILYGMYELIERDVGMTYDSISYDLKSKLIIDSKEIKDTRCLALIKEFESLGCRVFFSNLMTASRTPCALGAGMN